MLKRGPCASLSLLLFFFLQQGEVFIQLGLNLLHTFIGVFGGGVQLLLQQAQTDVGLTQLLTLGRGEVQSHWLCLFRMLFYFKLADFCKTLHRERLVIFVGGVTLILRDFLTSLITVSLSSSLTPRPSASVISALTVDALISTGGG